MKKMMVFIAAFMLCLSALAYAGGDKNCGDVGQGSTGSDGQGTVSQNRAPLGD